MSRLRRHAALLARSGFRALGQAYRFLHRHDCDMEAAFRRLALTEYRRRGREQRQMRALLAEARNLLAPAP